jgi:alpha-tubulin suppressor-like RCC1 family protein
MLALCIKIAKLLESLNITTLSTDYGVTLLELQALTEESIILPHLQAFYQLLVDYKHQKPNYFGTFKDSIYIVQAKLMYEGLSEKFFPQGDLVFCMFWKKYFTKHKTTISLFIHAFNLLFGEHNLEQVEKWKLHFSNSVDYDYILSNCDTTFYEWYQSFSFFGKTIRVCGPRMFKDLFVGYNIKQISLGYDFALFLTIEGNVYSFGKASFGKLGHGDLISCDKPRLIQYFRHYAICITSITCGFAFCCAITQSGNVYSWGANENGRLGIGTNEDSCIPCKLSLLEPITMICAGSVHTVALTDSGKVYSWGKWEYTGQNKNADVLLPTIVPNLKNIVQISVGYSGYHTLALDNLGQIYSWGHNRVGQLGFVNECTFPQNTDNSYYYPKPKLVDLKRFVSIKKIKAGWGNSAFITENGLYVCGRNDYEQLGISKNDPICKINERNHTYIDQFTKVNGVQNVENVEFGETHCVIQCKEQNIISLGKLDLQDNLGNYNIESIQCGLFNSVVISCQPTVPSLQSLCLNFLKKNFFIECLEANH